MYRLFAMLLVLATCFPSFAQPSFDTTSVAPERFIAAHGRRAVVMGYASGGLELWAYPLQIASDYRIGIRFPGNASEIDGSNLLRRVSYDPEGITRIYIGPGFIVRERLFVLPEHPAMQITYTVEGSQSVEVVVHFAPVLNLMWPGSLGGQGTQWSVADSAYRLSDGTQKYRAWIGSREAVSHDEVWNSAQPGIASNRLAFAVHPRPNATVVVTTERDRLNTGPASEAEAHRYYDQLAAGSLQIETPDKSLNDQLAWAQVALDQAWVCNPVLGCGMVAGYGPSRNARRPQYDWFFAGDGMIAAEALVSAGSYSRAREELDFVAKYQDSSTGMIWHELAQSADPADWATRYPYMFVHVDITFDYLVAVEHYVTASDDKQFLQQHWQGIEAAYRYCRSLLNPADGLPRIPSTKEGGDEQDRMSEDAGLSLSWIAAAEAFSKLAKLEGRDDEAEDAKRLSARAQTLAGSRYWEAQRNEWVDGFTEAGKPIFRRGANGIHLVSGRVLDAQRSDLVLDRLASADFQSDWGTRGVAATSNEYDPTSYAKGSVSAASTARVATVYWASHRPFTAFPIWSAILPWGTLDSMGHMHEVLTGDFYRQQVESVPEQTWSSAAFLSAAVHGLLGLERDGAANRVHFSPHLPARWDTLAVSHIPVKGGTLAFRMNRVAGGLDVEVENTGEPVDLDFAPEIPLGARLGSAELDGKSVPASIEQHAQDTHARLAFTLHTGKSRCLIRFAGGIEIAVEQSKPLVGEASSGVRIVSVSRQGRTLTIEADVARPGSMITLRTNERPVRAQGAKLQAVSGPWWELALDSPNSGGYRRTQVVVNF